MFRLSKNARKWGSDLVHNKKSSVIKIEFDLYYIYLLVGLGLGKSSEIREGGSDELARNYPGKYQAQRHKIAMLLIYTDLKASGFDTKNKNIVKSKIEETITSASPNLLTESAGKILNNFANAGYEAIRDKMNKVEPDDSLFLKFIYEEFLSDQNLFKY